VISLTKSQITHIKVMYKHFGYWDQHFSLLQENFKEKIIIFTTVNATLNEISLGEPISDLINCMIAQTKYISYEKYAILSLFFSFI
jgi:hypothetical protein